MSISIVVPIYNECENVQNFLDRLLPVIEKINVQYEVIFVLDPCKDNSEEIIINNINKNSNLKLIKMSRRFGQPAAILAGIKNCSHEHAVLIDVDLQDPPELIQEMYDYAKKGYDTILAERSSKIGENFLRKIIANVGYFLISKLSDTNIPMNVGEFRMISKKL